MTQVESPEPDRLEQMFAQQLEFQQRLGYDFKAMTVADRIAYITHIYVAAVQELGEVLNETSWKSWTTSEFVNDGGVILESVDAWHFLMNMVLAAMPGCTPNFVAATFFDTYQAKIKTNHRRQDDGYDGLNKCPRCGRAYDDESVRCHGREADYYFCDETGITYRRDHS